MTIEVLGMVSTSYGSESVGWQGGPVVDVDYLTRFAQAHDRAGFDRILVPTARPRPTGSPSPPTCCTTPSAPACSSPTAPASSPRPRRPASWPRSST